MFIELIKTANITLLISLTLILININTYKVLIPLYICYSYFKARILNIQ